MEFYGLKCPVCDEQFKDGDDIVVCPECGTPHHRACWEIENHCAFEDKHGEDFEYDNQSGESSDITYCSRCGSANPKTSFYCSKCGNPINVNGENNGYNNQAGANANPFASAFDPMAGINPEEDMGGVTAGELAKFVGNNTPYYMRVFSRLKTFGRGRFSLCGFFFNGFFLLYRKMYKIGALVAAAMILLLVAETYIGYSSAYTALESAIKASAGSATGYFSGYTTIINAFMSLDFHNQMMIFLMAFCSTLRLAIQIIVGFLANRLYFNHCRNQVKKIKETEDNPGKAIESQGGVNLALAISMGAIYAAIYIIPNYIIF